MTTATPDEPSADPDMHRWINTIGWGTALFAASQTIGPLLHRVAVGVAAFAIVVIGVKAIWQRGTGSEVAG